MSFLDNMKNKFNEKQFVKIESLDYMKGGFLKKLTTREILSMGKVDKEIEDNQKATDRFIGILSKHVHDDKKELLFSEDKDFLQEMPIGDVMSLFEELMKASGAKTDIEKKSKK